MPRLTLPERLTEQFYAWELRGRGWQEFSQPVVLEPPYIPFAGYFLPQATDDGHRPSFLSRILAPSRPVEDLPELEEPEPEAFDSDEPLVECAVSLPSSEAVSPASAERFLLSLSGGELPLVFEVVGLPDELRVQFVSRRPDAGLLANQLRAFFPEVSISPEEESLRHALARGTGETVALHFGLAREFMLPLASFRSLDPDPLLPLFGALSELEPGEAGLVQILFERVREEWAESVMRAVHSPRGDPFFADYPELTKQAREKISRPLYAACLRLAAKSQTASGAWRIIRDLAGALTHFGDPAGNELSAARCGRGRRGDSGDHEPHEPPAGHDPGERRACRTRTSPERLGQGPEAPQGSAAHEGCARTSRG